MIIEDWRRDYNANRPHSAHGELTRLSSLYSGPRPINPKPHSDWTTKRVPFSEAGSPGATSNVDGHEKRCPTPRLLRRHAKIPRHLQVVADADYTGMSFE